MSAGAFLDKIKNAFSIGANNKWLFGGGQPYDDMDAYEGEESSYSGAYGGYDDLSGNREQPNYQQPNYQQPNYQQAYGGQNYGQQNYMGQNYPEAPYQQQAYQGQGYQQPNYQQEGQSAAYAKGYYEQGGAQEAELQFQSQFAPEGYSSKQPVRNRRADQRRRQDENVVPFPDENASGAQKTAQPMDAYVINVSNVAACRQAMICLRKGQCAIIVMDRITDRAETRRYVDMLTGACYALNGTMTRLSSKIGFYLMAPSGMTVYTDAVTSNANNPRQMQTSDSFAQRRPGDQAGFNASARYSGAQYSRGAQQGGFGANPYNMEPNMQQDPYRGQSRYEAPAVSHSVRQAYYPQNEMAQ